MSESIASGVEAQPAPGPGALLRMAREARGVSVSEVAAALKLSPRQIDAIENDDFSRLSGATFIRGFVRNYARLLKIDSAPLLAALEEKSILSAAVLNAPIDVGVKMPTGNGKHGKGLVMAAAFALGVFGAALALYFDVIDLRPWLPAMTQGEVAPSPQTSQSQIAQPAIVQPASTVLAAPAADQPADADKPQEAAENAASLPIQPKLVFDFDGNSWVEVREAGGRVVFSQMNPKGTTQVVEGRPPFQLVVGNASHVRLKYNEQPVDLRPHTRVEVARLTLE